MMVGAMKFHNDCHYTEVPSINPTCHSYEVGNWVPVKLLGSNCGNTRERSGALPYHLVEANEKGSLLVALYFGRPI